MEEQTPVDDLLERIDETAREIYDIAYFIGFKRGRQVGFDEAKEMFNVNNDTYES